MSASFYNVSPGYFATLQIPLRDGRDFNEFDTRSAPLVAIVNRALAERLFDGDAIGSSFATAAAARRCRSSASSKTANTPPSRETRRGAIFRPLCATVLNLVDADRRAATPRCGAAPRICGSVIHRIDPGLPIRSSATGEQLTALPLFPYRAAVAALGLLGLIASGLLLSGLHAMLAYAVVKRQREIGIRVALGADRASVVHAVLSRVFVILAIGLALGALLSSGTGPMVSSLVLGVSPRGARAASWPSSALLAVIALVSCAGPVRRSLRVDPLMALTGGLDADTAVAARRTAVPPLARRTPVGRNRPSPRPARRGLEARRHVAMWTRGWPRASSSAASIRSA